MKRSKLIFFALVALAVSLVTAEVAVRLMFSEVAATADTMQFSNPHRDQPESFVRDPLLFWKLKAPNPAWQVNEDGYRGPRRTLEKPVGTLRVACLGDSCTFGLGNPPLQYEQTYAALLEALLTERLGRPVEVLNFGCPGYTSWQGRQLLRAKALDYGPDVVTAYFGINDGFEAIGYPDAEQQPAPELAADLNPLQESLRRSSLYLLMTRGVGAARRSTAPDGALRVSFDEFRANAAAMRHLGKERGFEVLFVPAHFIDDQGGLSVEEASKVEPSVPLSAAFAASGLPADELFYPAPDRVHPTTAGHRVIAEVLAEAIAPFLQNAEIK
jgi:lysophospholipase L1-like esterase